MSNTLPKGLGSLLKTRDTLCTISRGLVNVTVTGIGKNTKGDSENSSSCKIRGEASAVSRAGKSLNILGLFRVDRQLGGAGWLPGDLNQGSD